MNKNSQLLPRDGFRNAVFIRDGMRCVICQQPAVDAHHIIERRLFEDGGYYLDNGASLCSECHLKAEMTQISCEQIREAIGIKTPVLPQHLYRDVCYDKWGNPMLTKDKRLQGELFWDHSVQKVLTAGGVLQLYSPYVKYPRTFHVPWTGYKSKDDRTLTAQQIDNLFEQPIVITEKMDGENTTMYCDNIHARSVDGNSHWTQSWVRNFHNNIKHEIPPSWRFCGENMYAKHSIGYENLKSYFYLFSVWDEHNNCLSWQQTVEWAQLLDIETVPVIFEGQWNDKPQDVHKLWDPNNSEGYVIRNADQFNYNNFRNNVGKFVRPNHVTTSTHWKFRAIDLNKLTQS